MAALRARNNLFGLLGPVSLDDVLVLVRELYDIAERYGQRTWVQQALGIATSSSFDAGRWDDWVPEMLEEEPQAADFYRAWFRAERARRLAYRGRLAEAEAVLDDLMASDVVRGSVQASTGISLVVANLRLLQGRWREAFDAAKVSTETSDSSEEGLVVAFFAAAAAADPTRIREGIDVAEVRLIGDQPLTVATRQIGATLEALLEGRWDDARHGYVVASRLFEEIGFVHALALLRLVVGHLADDRFAEAVDGLRAAESYFRERGADSVVSDYRAKAATLPAVPRSSARPTDGVEVPDATAS